MAEGSRALVPPLDPPMMPVMLAGTGIWAVVGLVLLVADAPAGWQWTALAGFLLGCLLVVLMAVHDRRRVSSRG